MITMVNTMTMECRIDERRRRRNKKEIITRKCIFLHSTMTDPPMSNEREQIAGHEKEKDEEKFFIVMKIKLNLLQWTFCVYQFLQFLFLRFFM